MPANSTTALPLPAGAFIHISRGSITYDPPLEVINSNGFQAVGNRLQKLEGKRSYEFTLSKIDDATNLVSVLKNGPETVVWGLISTNAPTGTALERWFLSTTNKPASLVTNVNFAFFKFKMTNANSSDVHRLVTNLFQNVLSVQPTDGIIIDPT